MNNKIHEWDVLAYACIDGRFIKRTIDWISEKAGNTFDFNTGVGATKAINDSLIDRGTFFEVIKTSIRLHKIKEVWLFDHIDCGAYGGSIKFDNDAENERQYHYEKLEESANIVKNEFPDLIVKKFYVDWNEVSELN